MVDIQADKGTVKITQGSSIGAGKQHQIVLYNASSNPRVESPFFCPRYARLYVRLYSVVVE